MIVAILTPENIEKKSSSLLFGFTRKKVKILHAPNENSFDSASVIADSFYKKDFEEKDFLGDEYENFFDASDFIKKEAEKSEADVLIFITHYKYSFFHNFIEGIDNILLRGGNMTLSQESIMVLDFDVREIYYLE